MIEKLINEVFSNVISIVLDGITDQDKDEVSKNYLKYLYEVHSDIDINSENYAKMLSIITRIETKKWTSRDMNSKLYYFKDDESFEIIDAISKKAYSLALLRCKENSDFTISKEEARKYIDILASKVKSVLDFNKAEAERLVSESVLDFEYACGNSNDITSFRIGHIKK